MNRPFDADAVLRDDALLDALGRGEMPDEFADDETIRLLLAWRDDVVSDLDLDLAEDPPVAVPEESPLRRRWWKLSRRASVAATVAAIGAVSLGGVAAASSEPGSPLWPIAKVVRSSEQVESMEARASAMDALRQAEAAQSTDPVRARQLANSALVDANKIRDNRVRDDVRRRAGQFTDLASPTPRPSPTLASPTPGKTDDSVPVPPSTSAAPIETPAPSATPSPTESPTPSTTPSPSESASEPTPSPSAPSSGSDGVLSSRAESPSDIATPSPSS